MIKRKLTKTVLAIFITFSMFNNVWAQKDTVHVKKNLLPRPPIYGIPAKTLPKGKAIYRSYFVYTNFTSMYSQKKLSMVDLPTSMKFNSLSYTPKFRYGITNRLTFIANFPLYYKKMDKDTIHKQGLGLGDVQTALLYKFYSNKKKRFLVSGLLYGKLPTGKSSGISKTELPLGTGSYDVGTAFMPEKEFGRFDVRMSMFYIYRSENSSDVKLGNVQMASLSTAYNFSKKIIAEGTILYKHINANSLNGTVLKDSDGEVTKFIIGAQYRVAQTFLIQAAIPVTLYSKLPFSSDYDIWAGIYYLW